MDPRVGESGRSERVGAGGVSGNGADRFATTPVESPRGEEPTVGPVSEQSTNARQAEIESTAHYEPTVTMSVDAQAGAVCGRFRVVKPHARGGLGEVYVADDTEVRRSVALKRIRRQFNHDADSKARFLREAAITGKLEHPGIVPIYGVGTDADGQPYYAMRFIEGESLKESLARFHDEARQWKNAGERMLELRKLLQRFLDVCNAMEYAHSRGIMHRDLKPANIMVGKYGETLVVDWGLAKPIGEREGPSRSAETHVWVSADDMAATEMGQAIGTPYYMSPEQASGRQDRLGAATDIYALGAVLYSILSGRPPVKGESREEVLVNVCEGTLEPLAAGVAPALASICCHAMALEPEARYASARALADDVEKWLADERVTVHREAFFERAARWSRTHRAAMTGVIALAATAIVALGAGLLVLSAEQRKTAQEKQTAELRQREAETARAGEAEAREKADAARTTAEERKREAERERGVAEILKAEAEDERRKATEERDRAEQTAYIAHIQAADAEWERNQVRRALAHLETTPERLRGWEFDYFKAKFQRGHRTISGEQQQWTAVKYSPDGKLIAGGADHGKLAIWDAESGKLRGVFGNPARRISKIAFSADSKRIATARRADSNVETVDSMAIDLWDAATGNEIRKFSGHDKAVTNIAFTPDGKHLLSCSYDRTIRLWDVATGMETKLVSPMTNRLYYAALDPEGKRIVAVGENGTIAILDSESGTTIRNWNTGNPRSYEATFSPDGKKILFRAAGSFVELFEAETGKSIHKLTGNSAKIYEAVFSRDGKLVAGACSDATVKLWSVETGSEVRSLRGQLWVQHIDISPDGLRIVSSGADVQLWDLAATPEGRTFATQGGPIHSVEFSSDGKRLLIGGGIDNRLFDLEQESEPEVFAIVHGTFKVAADHVVLSPDGKQVAGLYGSSIYLFDVARGERRQIKGKYRGRLPGLIAFHPDGRSFGSVHRRTVKSIDVATGGELWAVNQPEDDVDSFQFSPDGKTLVVGIHGGSIIRPGTVPPKRYTAQILDAATGAELHRFVERSKVGVSSKTIVVFNRQGDLVATNYGGVRLFDTVEFVERRHFPGLESATALAFNHDGKRLATGHGDGVIRILDVASEREIVALRGHVGSITRLVFSPDGRLLASGGEDKTARLWDARPVVAP